MYPRLFLARNLLKDDGAGIKVLKILQEEFIFPENVSLIDAGTTIYHNMEIMSHAEKLIVLDAVKLGGKPGTLYQFSPEEYHIKMPRKATSHDVGLLEAYTTMKLIEKKLPETIIIGIQPKDYQHWGETLSEEVQQALPLMVEKVLKQLNLWGITPISKKES